MTAILIAALLSTSSTTPSHVPAHLNAPERVQSLQSFEDAEVYLGLRGVVLTQGAMGAHASREGKMLYDEKVFVANGTESISVFRFADEKAATELAGDLVQHNPGSQAIVRGRIVILTTNEDLVVAASLSRPTLIDGPQLGSLDEVDALLAERGFHVAKKKLSQKTSLFELAQYTIDTTDGDATISVYRFQDDAAATRFRDAVSSGRRALNMGHVVFVVPDTDDAGSLFDRLAAK